MPYESTIVVTIPEDGTFLEIKQHIAAVTNEYQMDPDKWSITVTSDPHNSWGFIYYEHPSPLFLDKINLSWKQRFPNSSIERIHRISQPKFFEDIANKTTSGMIGIGMVQHLIDLSAKGVSTNGMIDWMQDVGRDSLLIIDCLQKVRGSPYEPGKDTSAYP